MQKSIKRLITLLMVLLVVLVNSMTVFADVAFEPMNADFLSSHYSDCYSEERLYLADGPNGKATIYESPKDKSEIGTLNNGAQVWVYYIYKGKVDSWGYVEDWSQNAYGWVPMDYLQEQYDIVAFRSQYGKKIKSKEWKLGDEFYYRDIYVWDFPGYDGGSFTLHVSGEDDTLCGSEVYTDEYGNDWGYFSYFYGSDGWVCLSNPTGTYDELYPNGGPVYELDSSDDNSTKDDNDANKTDKDKKDKNDKIIEPSGPDIPVVLIVILGVLVVTVIALTVILLVILGKKKKNDQL